MKAILLVIGKTDETYVNEGIDKYSKRINKYLPFNLEVIPDLKHAKNLGREQQKEKEGELILKKINQGDVLILLDEGGKEFNSHKFSNWMNSLMLSGKKRMIFVVGGPYGFSEQVYQKADFKLSLSKMTFSHQIIRLLFCEQFYRAHTILKGEPYHHD
ncbi:MAG: 23S rRNA (pseudouridine(1915)-N(3))-methyltransferase RlmH [Bacteroidetes bacterium HGW-Bacteroidetes-4]|nr:MAG: 23S rRNA (pseudouridine(1915)-N(3))-methyltransferase RlmH [Bacteroidetes bacterium HGW-Bacteroidetes-4]